MTGTSERQSSSSDRAILAVGDCNTLGAGALLGDSYPERVAFIMSLAVDNLGCTMATSREGVFLVRDHLAPDHRLVLIQFGLVDSYTTFRHAPYVLYYPDSRWRKPMRNIVKTLKKRCRKWGVHRLLGEENVVPLAEYRRNIQQMIDLCSGRVVVLPETIPHHEQWRNVAISMYNDALHEIAAACDNCVVLSLYDAFSRNLESFYEDATHANSRGCDYIAGRIADLVKTF